jgi:uncharacterized protein (DUF58 family)
MNVAPDLLHDDADRAGATGSGTRARSLLGAGGEVLQLREYRPGDPQHVIDWRRQHAPIDWSAAISPKTSISK